MFGMRILIAPDKFKGSLSARQVAENIALGIGDIIPDAQIEIAPVADGGEGTAEVICNARGGEWVMCRTHGPLGNPIEARYVWLGENASAVIEMSEAAGLRALENGVRDVLRANTFGVGEMFLDVAKRGAHEIIVGLGGSVTNDGGFGMARALGFRFFDERHKEIEKALDLISVAGIVAPVAADVSSVTSLKSQPASASGGPLQMRIIAACDVKNPLLGETGATRTFGPQKGATSEQLEILERALTRLADTVTRELGCDFRNKPGAGAAGGLGFGLMSFCGAELRPGFDVVAAAVELEEKIKSADVVITGEGKLDSQTLEGKAPAGVARLARKFGKRVFAVVGRAAADQQVREIFEGVYELRGSIPQARDLLRERARELGSALKY
ncbi:MAG: glycerate kinase [Verrucomicrobia bacterium]|nr:MAG: glycerate kinase [Verrucomicrobiota bacterium]